MKAKRGDGILEIQILRKDVNYMVATYKPIYTVREVAEILGTNVNYVYSLINTKELPSLRINNAKKIRGSDLERYIENLPVAE